MKEFDITFKCQYGQWKLSRAKEWPTRKQIEETIENLEALGVGKTKEIVITLL